MQDHIRNDLLCLYREMMSEHLRRAEESFHISQKYNYYAGVLDETRLGIEVSGYSGIHQHQLRIVSKFLMEVSHENGIEVSDDSLFNKLEAILDHLGEPPSLKVLVMPG